jgi:hypothetical protein
MWTKGTKNVNKFVECTQGYLTATEKRVRKIYNNINGNDWVVRDASFSIHNDYCMPDDAMICGLVMFLRKIITLLTRTNQGLTEYCQCSNLLFSSVNTRSVYVAGISLIFSYARRDFYFLLTYISCLS